MIEFFRNLGWYPIITGCCTILSATVTFILDRSSEKDGRKRFLGFFRKDLKRYSAFLTLLFAVMTLVIEDKHKWEEKLNGIIDKQKADKIQKDHFDSTLGAINHTLVKQDSTLELQRIMIDTTQIILDNQIKTFDGQTKTLKQTDSIISGQSAEFVVLKKVLLNVDDVNGTIASMSYNRKSDSQKNDKDDISKILYFGLYPGREKFMEMESRIEADSLHYNNFNSYDIEVNGKLNRIRNLETSKFNLQLFLLDQNAKWRSKLNKWIVNVDSSKWVHAEPFQSNGYDVNPVDSIPHLQEISFDLQNGSNFHYIGHSITSTYSMFYDLVLKASMETDNESITFEDLANRFVLVKVKPNYLGFRIGDFVLTKPHKQIKSIYNRFLRERYSGSFQYGSEREQYYLIKFGKLIYTSN